MGKDGMMNDVDVRTVRDWQERLFRIRNEANIALREASRLLELAALGGDEESDRLLRAAHQIEQWADCSGTLCLEIQTRVHLGIDRDEPPLLAM